MLAELAEEIPPAWYDDDYDALMRLLEQLYAAANAGAGAAAFGEEVATGNRFRIGECDVSGDSNSSGRIGRSHVRIRRII